VRGVQLGLGLILGWAALLLFSDNIILGLISMAIIIVLINNKKIPSAIVLTIIGIFIIFYTGALLLTQISLGLPAFEFQIPTWENILIGMLIAGIAQLVLTLANVMIATVKLSKDLFPDKKDAIDANSLALNMGLINIISPFLGGIPQCHGSGGLAAQYAFGARTGGSMIMEGILEIFLGLFCSNLLFLIFMEFPKAILGAMLLYTAILLGKIAFKDFSVKTAPIIIISGILCFIFNLVVGFLAGLVLYLIFKKKIKEQPQIVKESEPGPEELQLKTKEN